MVLNKPDISPRGTNDPSLRSFIQGGERPVCLAFQITEVNVLNRN